MYRAGHTPRPNGIMAWQTQDICSRLYISLSSYASPTSASLLVGRQAKHFVQYFVLNFLYAIDEGLLKPKLRFSLMCCTTRAYKTKDLVTLRELYSCYAESRRRLLINAPWSFFPIGILDCRVQCAIRNGICCWFYVVVHPAEQQTWK